ncbi:MAG TPA: TonB-dependent receptor [Steroidobacteraceae bacterium]|jgi:outer membrane receptor protein involved in Fe transport|nr:TonB-dependent receptor [Steroidobacteraceae bacterium]
MAAAVGLCCVGISIADDVRAPIKKPTNIPPEDLGTALQTLAKERNFQIVYVSEQINVLRTHGASGEFTPEEALKSLLNGTGFTFKYLDEKTVTIVPVAARPDMRKPPASPAPEPAASAASDGAERQARRGFWNRLRLAQISNDASASSRSESIEKTRDSDAAEDGAKLEEIIVTATRQARLLSTVPISASAFTRKTLDAEGADQIDDIALMTPGVTFTRGNSGTTQIAIRGINSDSGASTTGVYIDDTPVQSRVIGFSSTTVFPNVFDVDRVEILRGPQGTLFGAGSEGGTVRFITPQPSLTDYTDNTHGELGFTEHGDPSFEARAALGGPLVENEIGFRASVSYRRDGGYTDRVDRFGGGLIAKNDDWQNSYNARLAFAVEPVDHLRITPSFYYQDIYIDDSQTYWEYLSDPAGGRFNNGAPVTAPFRATSYLPALNVNYQADAFTVTSNTSFYQQDNRNNRDLSALIPNDLGVEITPTHPVPGDPGYKSQDLFVTSQKAFTQEIRIQSSDLQSSFTWVAGVFYQHEHQASDQYVPDTPASFDRLVEAALGESTEQAFGMGLAEGVYSYRSIINSIDSQIAGFGELNLQIVDRLTLTAGLRVERSTFNFTNRSDGPFNGGLTVVNGNESETPVIPKYGVSYQIDPGNLLYATAAKGFRTGGANAAIPSRCDADLASLGYPAAPDSYKSDSVWSFEVGSKNRLLDGRLRLQSSIFDVKWSGIQQQVTLGTGCGLNFVANLGRATSRGFDLQGEYLAGDHLTTGLALGYDDAVFDQSIMSPPDPVTGVRPVLVRTGNSLGVNPWMAAVNAQYDFAAWGRRAYLRVDDQFASRQSNPTPAEDPRNQTYASGLVELPQTNLLSLRLGIRFDNGVDLSLFVKNALDSHPVLSRTQVGSNLDLIYADRTFRPRTIGITINSKL